MENLTKNEEILLYDAANAANYALTYSGSDTSFYNENFNSYADVGGDCMNFASQSIWAGLGMDNSPHKISNGKLFKNLKDSITPDGWYKDSLAWVGVTPFQQFVQKQKDPNLDGLVTTTWEIGANQWDLNIPEEYLPKFQIINKKVITPSVKENEENNRSRSSKLRIIERIR